ncbi:MAG: hypothetical protein ACE37N_08970 [Pseudohongiellaceae bacterium]
MTFVVVRSTTSSTATVRWRVVREQPDEVVMDRPAGRPTSPMRSGLRPNPDGWFDDVTEQVREASDIRDLVAEFDGRQWWRDIRDGIAGAALRVDLLTASARLPIRRRGYC